MRVALPLALLLAGCATASTPANLSRTSLDHGRVAILDAHLHAFPDETRGKTADQMLEAMDSAGIDRAAVHFIRREMYDDWAVSAPDRFLKGVSFPCWPDARGELFMCNWDGGAWPDIDWLRDEIEAGRLKHFGEMSFVYSGIDPADARMEPYWQLADEFDLPVMVHINRGPPADHPMRKSGCCPRFDSNLGDPDRLRPVLERWPNLRIVLQHFGFPPLPMFQDIGYLEQSIALMHEYRGVMADMSTFHSVPFVSTQVHADTVRRLKDEALLDRLMFATDNWNAASAIARYQALDFLTKAEQQAILHDNAARLFGVD